LLAQSCTLAPVFALPNSSVWLEITVAGIRRLLQWFN